MNKPVKFFFLFSILAAVFSTVSAESFEDLIGNALDTDLQLRIQKLSLESREISIERANLDAPFGVSAGTGTSGVKLVQTFGDSPSTTVTLDPEVSLVLAEGIETKVSLSADIDLGLSDGVDPALKPVLAVSQPLNPLFGLTASEHARKLDENYSLYQARIAVWSREQVIKKDVAAKVKAAILAEKNVIVAERSLVSAEDKLNKAKVLETFNPESRSFLELVHAFEAAVRGIEIAHLQADFARGELNGVVGRPVTDIPREAPPVSLVIPRIVDSDLYPAVQSANMNLVKAETALDEHHKPFIPQYGVRASYAFDPQTAGAGLTAAFENFSIGANLTFDVDDEFASLAITADWSFPDNRAKHLKARELENALEISRMEAEQAYRKAMRTADLLRLEVRNLENRLISLEQKLQLEELTLAEKRKRFELGDIGEQELNSQEWAVESLHIDRMLLSFDIYLLSLDITSLAF